MRKWIRKGLSWLIRRLFLKNRPLAVQLFAWSAVLVSVPMLAVGWITYQQSSSALQLEATEYNQEVLEQVKSHIEYYIRDFEIINIKILNHPDMIALLSKPNREQAVADDTLPKVETLLANTAFSQVDVSNIVLYLDAAGMIQAAKSYPPYPDDIHQEYWYQSVPANGEPIVVTRTIRWPSRNERVLSLIRRVYSPQTLQPVGFLIMDINIRRLQEIAQIFDLRGRSFYILDANGYYIYHPVRAKIGQAAEPKIAAAGRNPELLELIDQGEGQKVFFTGSQSHPLNWRFLISIPYEKIAGSSAALGKIIFWTILLTLAVAYLLGSAYLTTILRPLRCLRDLMKKVQVGNLTVSAPVESQDEIGSLSAGFNKMVARLNELVEEVYLSRLRETKALLGQRETEMKALQAQVNPHFIGNSLETIRGMALEKGVKDIASMAERLGSLLRYNLWQGSASVELGEEIKYLKIYLEIQKYRFGDIGECQIEIPEWAWKEHIVKFSLQPLVENCFTHGISDHTGKMKIMISASAEADGSNAFLLHIRDTGSGMDEERLAKVSAILINDDADAVGHIGIINVHRRILNAFGAGYGVRLKSSPGGTTVSIRLPRKNTI